MVLSIEGSDGFVASSAASIATGQATLPRRDFHPLEYTRIHGARTGAYTGYAAEDVDRGRSREVGGTGLGLAIVKHIALAHGGWLSVESKVGVGSTFTIHLPAE